MSMESHPFKWLRFAVRFVFGAIFGGIFALYLAASAESRSDALLIIVILTLLFGAVSGFWGDRFWESFRDSGFWNLFRW